VYALLGRIPSAVSYQHYKKKYEILCGPKADATDQKRMHNVGFSLASSPTKKVWKQIEISVAQCTLRGPSPRKTYTNCISYVGVQATQLQRLMRGSNRCKIKISPMRRFD